MLARLYSLLHSQVQVAQIAKIEADFHQKSTNAAAPGKKGKAPDEGASQRPEGYFRFCRLASSGVAEFVESKSLLPKELLRPDLQYVMIKFVFKSFNRYLSELKKWSRSFAWMLQAQDSKVKKLGQRMQLGFEMASILPCIEQTLNSNWNAADSENSQGPTEPDYGFSDFFTQFRGRILKDAGFTKIFNADEQQAIDLKRAAFLRNNPYDLGLLNSINSSQGPAVGAKEPPDAKYQYVDEYLSQIACDWFGSFSVDQRDDYLSDIDASSVKQKSVPGSYFQNFHQAFRENQRVELVEKMPGCIVLAVKFYGKNSVFVSLSNGLILLYNTVEWKVEKIFANKGAVIDCLKVLWPTYLITSGIDSKIRIWNVQTEKLFKKFEIHKYATQ